MKKIKNPPSLLTRALSHVDEMEWVWTGCSTWQGREVDPDDIHRMRFFTSIQWPAIVLGYVSDRMNSRHTSNQAVSNRKELDGRRSESR